LAQEDSIYLFLFDLLDGKVTEEEKKQMRKYLLEIMRKPESLLKNTNNSPQDVKNKKI
jgi:hypothetical protein